MSEGREAWVSGLTSAPGLGRTVPALLKAVGDPAAKTVGTVGAALCFLPSQGLDTGFPGTPEQFMGKEKWEAPRGRSQVSC